MTEKLRIVCSNRSRAVVSLFPLVSTGLGEDDLDPEVRPEAVPRLGLVRVVQLLPVELEPEQPGVVVVVLGRPLRAGAAQAGTTC